MADNEVKIKVTTEESGSGLRGLIEKLQSVPLLGSAAASAFGMVATAAGAMAAAFGAAHRALEEFAASEEVSAKLDAALARSGKLTEEFRTKLQQLSGELQRTTGVADEEWVSVLTRLVQFGSTPESIGMDAEAVKNLAGLVGDVGTAANMYSRALQGNFEVFGRYGIEVSKTGDQLAKLKDLQEQLAQRGGGQLEASTRTLNGAFRNLRNSVSDVFESMGKMLVDTLPLRQATNGLSTAFQWLNDKIGESPERLSGLRNALGATTDGEKAAADATARLSKELKEAERAAEASTRALERRLGIIERMRGIEETKIDSRGRLEIAQIDLAEAEGRMTGPQAKMARARVQDRMEVDKSALASKADEERLRVAGQAYTDSVYQEAALRRKSAEAAARAGGLSPREAGLLAEADKLVGANQAMADAAKENSIWKYGLGDDVGERLDAAEALRLRIGGRAQARTARANADSRRYAELAQLQSGVTEQRRIALEGLRAEVEPGMAARGGLLAERRLTSALGAERGLVEFGQNSERSTSAWIEKELSNLQQGSKGAKGSVSGAAAEVSAALRETIDVSKRLAAEVASARTELRTLQAQIKATSNR